MDVITAMEKLQGRTERLFKIATSGLPMYSRGSTPREVTDAVNDLGAQGWELVSATSNRWLFFKRTVVATIMQSSEDEPGTGAA